MHGAHPLDRELFPETELVKIRAAAIDARYLLGRGYAQPSVLKLVGDRFQLTSRQRQLLFRGACDPAAAKRVRETHVKPEAIRGSALCIDGHNVLITVETALAGGILIRGDDGFLRDIAERHGAYRQGGHTERAIEILREGLRALAPARTTCYLDRPLPFSGLLAQRLRESIAGPVAVEVADSADGAIKDALGATAGAIVATSDSAVLRAAGRTFDLTSYLVAGWVPGAWIVALD